MQRPALLGLIICVSFLAATSYRTLGVHVRDIEAIGSRPTLISEFSDGAPVQQRFTFPRNGLRSIAIAIWSEQALHLEVELELRLSQPPAADIVIATVKNVVAQPAGNAWHAFELVPIPYSRDQIFIAVFHLRGAIGTTVRRGSFGMMAWADDAIPAGVLAVGGREREGDLSFVALADTSTRFERLVEGLDEQLLKGFSPGIPSLLWLVGLSGALTLVVAGIAITSVTRLPEIHNRAAPMMSPHSSVTSVLLLAGVVAAAGGLWANREQLVIDLMRNIDTATIEAPLPIRRAFGLPDEPINGVRPYVIFAHPPSRLTWRITLPHGKPMLKTAVALRPHVWEGRSDGVTFNIHLQDGNVTEPLYSKFVDPARRLEDRAWIPVEVDLSRFAGRPVGVTLETTPGPSGDVAFDWAMWAHPRIVEGR